MLEPPPRGRRLRSDQRRTVILDSAGPLFAQAGYDATRLSDVADAANVTKPALYRHFDSKAALYLALLRRHGDDLRTFVAEIPPAGTIAARMRAVLEIWFDYVERHAYAWRLLFHDTGGGPAIAAERREVADRAREVLIDVIRANGLGSIDAEETVALAELMSAGMAGLVMWWIDDPAVRRGPVVDAMVRAWVGLLSTPATLS